MTPNLLPTRSEQLETLAATLRRVRWFCVVFAAIQFTIYDAPKDVPLPHPVAPWGVAVCAWLLATNLITGWMARGGDVARRERAAAVEVAADTAVVLGVVALMAFDPIGAEWGLLAIVVLEGALRLPLAGAIACWAIGSLAYTGIEVWAMDRYAGIDDRVSVTTFRLGMVLTIGVIGGALAQQLRRHLIATGLAQEQADERARLLRIAADAGRSLASLGGTGVLDAVVQAAFELGFDAVDVCALDESNG
jgi:hypothetical protein